MSSGIMETMAQSQMECPREVYCSNCGWIGLDNELHDNIYCPYCNSVEIDFYNEEEYQKMYPDKKETYINIVSS